MNDEQAAEIRAAVQILDENGDRINQLATVEEKPVNPMLAAFFKVAYDRDPEFKQIVDEAVEGFKRAVEAALAAMGQGE